MQAMLVKVKNEIAGGKMMFKCHAPARHPRLFTAAAMFSKKKLLYLKKPSSPRLRMRLRTNSRFRAAGLVVPFIFREIVQSEIEVNRINPRQGRFQVT